MKVSRRTLLAGASAFAIPAGLKPAWAQEKAVRYGISMADIPLTTGQPDRGAGAYQFTGLTIYDPLVAWELDIADRPGKMIPGLATEWKVNDADKTLWTFRLRDGVKFHDGSAFNADAVVTTGRHSTAMFPAIMSSRNSVGPNAANERWNVPSV